MKFEKFLRKEFFIIDKLPFLTFLNDHVVSFSNDKETSVKKIGGHQVSFQDMSFRSKLKSRSEQSSSIIAMVTVGDKIIVVLDENKFCNRVIHKFCYDVE